EPIKLATDHHVVRGEKLRPAVVAEVGRLSGRADDVREEDGTQHRFRLGLPPRTGEEALRLRRDRLDEPDGLITVGDLDPFRLGDPLRHVLGVAAVVRPAPHEVPARTRRYTDPPDPP